MIIFGSSVGLSSRPRSHVIRASQPQVRSRDGANSTKKLCILSAIKPSNVESEKAKFFKSDFRYNPQFEYSNPVSPHVLEKHSKASDRFLTQAVRIMELALNKYGNYENFEQATGGSLLSKSRIWAHVKKYMEKEDCVGEIVVHLTSDLLSRASMTVVKGRPTLTINISMAREQWLEGMLRHEIGTHYLRSINNSQQPWSRGAGRRELGLKPINPTEEGLASIHSVLFREDPWLWRAAFSTTPSTRRRTCPSLSSSTSLHASSTTPGHAGTTAYGPNEARRTPRNLAASIRTRCIWTASSRSSGTDRRSTSSFSWHLGRCPTRTWTA
ncbi:hypothetical protein HF521_015822 [Silurus meridionalis]|uniref:Uncharacterized protein n=1 Tax=Silurus meridionalis TaxID=175797 RepID=A0A8T0A6G6_SILME|nr:hypothetical protein HF521_015822 [Silurus meridionalis]